MAKSKLLKISHGPLPGAQESCLTLQLLLSSQEVSQVLKSQERLCSTLPWFEASLNPNSSDEVKAGEYIVQLARALLNELGGLIATATCQDRQGRAYHGTQEDVGCGNQAQEDFEAEGLRILQLAVRL